jgi:hypothetical protein
VRTPLIENRNLSKSFAYAFRGLSHFIPKRNDAFSFFTEGLFALLTHSRNDWQTVFHRKSGEQIQKQNNERNSLTKLS